MGLGDANTKKWLTTFKSRSRRPTRFHINRLYINVTPWRRCQNETSEENLLKSSDFDVKQHLQEANLTLAGKAHELYSEKY